jgi:ATP/maltotriose-dependent transcriptional regulator MalT
VIVLDEVENVTDADALRGLDALFADLPSSASILLITRAFPEINVSLLSVRGRCTLLKPELLRFRTWEIDDLFQSVYGTRLAPYELAELERRTGGWAAGLQLFHLATERGGEDLRRSTLAAMGGRRGPSWEFLARNVVDALTPELRGFLLDVVGMHRLRVAAVRRAPR